MTPMDEYHLKQQIQKQKRQLEDLQKELEKDQKGKLTDREKFILHFCCMLTTAKITNTTGGLPPVDFVLTLIDDVRRNRFRSLSTEDMSDLLEEINEEMLAGKIMFQHMIDEKTWSMTGEHPNKNTNWRDMR